MYNYRKTDECTAALPYSTTALTAYMYKYKYKYKYKYMYKYKYKYKNKYKYKYSKRRLQCSALVLNCMFCAFLK